MNLYAFIKSALATTISISAAGFAHAENISGRYEAHHNVPLYSEKSGNVDVVDFIEIEQPNDEEISFIFESIHINGHSCRLYGKARHIDGKYEFTETYDWNNEKCVAYIYKSGDNIIVEEADRATRPCSENSCGARGDIGKTYFPYITRKPVETPLKNPW